MSSICVEFNHYYFLKIQARPTEIPSPERAKSHIINDAFVFVSILGTIGLQFTGMFLPGWWSLPPESKGAGGEDINVNDSKAIKLGLWFTVVCNSSSCYSRPTDTSGSNGDLNLILIGVN